MTRLYNQNKKNDRLEGPKPENNETIYDRATIQNTAREKRGKNSTSQDPNQSTTHLQRRASTLADDGKKQNRTQEPRSEQMKEASTIPNRTHHDDDKTRLFLNHLSRLQRSLPPINTEPDPKSETTKFEKTLIEPRI